MCVVFLMIRLCYGVLEGEENSVPVPSDCVLTILMSTDVDPNHLAEMNRSFFHIKVTISPYVHTVHL